jgi:hypothetical protein
MTGILNALIAGVSGAVKDTYFNLVSLLLPGNGTNGAQNNTFLDSGTANSGSGFTITRNGDTTQGTFSPFSQTGWGAYFDGSNDYVSTPDSSAFDLAAVDWTIESWVYLNSLPSSTLRYTILGQWNSGANQLSYITQLYNNSGTMQLEFVYTANGSTATSVQVNATAVVANSWIHIAFVRDGSRLKFFVNGSEVTTSSNTISATIYNSSGNIEIGRNASATTNYINGYLSNLRLVKGTAVYTSNFTPSTTPLTAITNTSLLTFQSNRFVDNAATPNTLTPNNGVAITPFSPFAPTAAYTTAAVGGSGYFDGTGDYLTVASPTTNLIEWYTSSVDFTVEAWVYPISLTNFSTGSNPVLCGNFNQAGTDYWSFGPLSSGTVRLRYFNGAGVSVDSTETVKALQWNHVAFTKTSSGVSIFVNGVGTTAVAISGTPQSSTGTPFSIASNLGVAMNAYVSNLRVVKGTAVYSGATYTVPTAPPTAITNTSLLLNFTNAGITDATAKNDLETVGNAQISTTQSKWGGGSMYFDGTGDWLVIPSSNLFILGTGDFTIEAWGYPSVVGGGGLSKGLFQITSSAGFSTSATNSLAVATTNPSGNWGCIAANAFNNSSTAAVVNTWYHLALVRNSGTTKLYVNGTSVLSFADTTNYTCTFLTIGGYYDTNNIWNGYIDDLRITKGYARYTGNFTPPTAPFPVQ